MAFGKTLMLIGGGIVLAMTTSAYGPALMKHFEDAVPGDPGDPEQVALGRTVYADNCADCHGINLEGEPNWRVPLPQGGLPAPPHDESGHTWHHGDKLLFDYTKRGGQAVIGDGGGFKSNMPGFGETLSDEEIWAVLAFIKSTWPPAQLKRQRALTAQEK